MQIQRERTYMRNDASRVASYWKGKVPAEWVFR